MCKQKKMEKKGSIIGTTTGTGWAAITLTINIPIIYFGNFFKSPS